MRKKKTYYIKEYPRFNMSYREVIRPYLKTGWPFYVTVSIWQVIDTQKPFDRLIFGTLFDAIGFIQSRLASERIEWMTRGDEGSVEIAQWLEQFNAVGNDVVRHIREEAV